MSKVSITGDNSGSGTFTVAAPNSNNNRTFNLPDEDGVVITDSSDIEPQVKTSLNATGDAPMFACRAFVNFNGTGTVSIRDSGNVSSVTDRGIGWVTVNLSNPMENSNYVAFANASTSNDTTYEIATVDRKYAGAPLTNGEVNVTTLNNNLDASDAEYVFVAVFG